MKPRVLICRMCTSPVPGSRAQKKGFDMFETQGAPSSQSPTRTSACMRGCRFFLVPRNASSPGLERSSAGLADATWTSSGVSLNVLTDAMAPTFPKLWRGCEDSLSLSLLLCLRVESPFPREAHHDLPANCGWVCILRLLCRERRLSRFGCRGRGCLVGPGDAPRSTGALEPLVDLIRRLTGHGPTALFTARPKYWSSVGARCAFF